VTDWVQWTCLRAVSHLPAAPGVFRFAEMCGCRQRTAVTPHRAKYDQVGDRIDAGKTDSCSRLGTEIFSGECPVFLNEGSVMQ